MKQTPEMDRIQQEMHPGIITQNGFLGDDSRHLNDMLQEQDAEIQRLGLTHEQIAARLAELRDAGVQGLGQPVCVEPHFEVTVDSVRGRLPCPFMHGVTVGKLNTTIRNLASDETITVTDLTIHLIEVHGFYGGRGAPFAITPEHLARFLELT